MELTKHFTLDEMTISQTAVRHGLKNQPNARQTECLRALCESVLEPLRVLLNRPIVISSGYRSRTVNARVGGSKSSQHCLGEAADIVVPGMEVVDVVEMIHSMRLPFDQLIDEGGRNGGWTHVSHSSGNRGEVLVATFHKGQTSYRRVA